MKIDPVYASVVPDLPATGRPPRSPRYSFTGPRRRSVIRYPSSGLITWTRGALGSKASNTVPSASTTFKTAVTAIVESRVGGEVLSHGERVVTQRGGDPVRILDRSCDSQLVNEGRHLRA